MQLKNYFGLMAVSALFACTTNNSTSEKAIDTTAISTTVDSNATVELKFKDEKLANIYNEYISLKDQLVATQFEGAKPAAGQLSALLKGYDGCEQAGLIAQKISESKDIATQRVAFTDLNTELIPLFKQAELTSGTIYLQHCPMANKGNGGDWLSSAKKIQNPYYGDEMMECGSVVEKITAK